MSIDYDTYMVMHFKIHIDETSKNKISTPISIRSYKNEAAYLDKEFLINESSKNAICINSNPTDERNKTVIKGFLKDESNVYALYKMLLNNKNDSTLSEKFKTVYNDYVNMYRKYLEKISNPYTKQTLITKETLLNQPPSSGNVVNNIWSSLLERFNNTNKPKEVKSFSFSIEKLYEYSCINNEKTANPECFIANLICAIKFINWLITDTGEKDLHTNYTNFINNENILGATLTLKNGVQDVEKARQIISKYSPHISFTYGGGRSTHLTRRAHNRRALRHTMKNAFYV
jgi:hypothetical protein